jgi:hypothetical protein
VAELRPGRGSGHQWALGPLLGLLVIAGVCTAAIPAQSTFAAARDRVAAAVRPAPVDAADRDAAARLRSVRTLLSARATALLRHDRAGWLAGVDPAATGLRARQSALLADIAAVPLGTWRYTVEPGDERGRVERGGAWTVRVTLHYALRDADLEPTERPLVLSFADRAGRWLISADDRTGPDGSKTWRGPWEHGRLLVRAGPSSLVLAHPANARRLAAFVATADAVVPRVRAAVGGKLPRRVAVLIPDDEKEMASLVGEKLVLGTIAAVAVADSVDTDRDKAIGQRIVVNPANIDRLGQLGRRVVLEHEVTHLATRGVTGSRTPIWLVEGLADWVGYRDSGLPAYQVGDELHAALNAGHWPGRLPVAADFKGDSPRLALAYEEAWSACRLIADRAGPAALVRLYRTVGTAADPAAALDAQLRATMHAGTKQFTMQWRHSVQAEFR